MGKGNGIGVSRDADARIYFGNPDAASKNTIPLLSGTGKGVRADLHSDTGKSDSIVIRRDIQRFWGKLRGIRLSDTDQVYRAPCRIFHEAAEHGYPHYPSGHGDSVSVGFAEAAIDISAVHSPESIRAAYRGIAGDADGIAIRVAEAVINDPAGDQSLHRGIFYRHRVRICVTGALGHGCAAGDEAAQERASGEAHTAFVSVSFS